MAKISAKSQSQVQVDDGYLLALAKQGSPDAYERLVRRYYSFVRLKASSYFLAGGDSDDLIQEGLVGLYKAIRDYRSDRESSFRNFAELCITRQIITAIKTATRFKHAPLNTYVSFSHTPAGQDDSDCTLGDALPGPGVDDPVVCVISTEELQSLVFCLGTGLSPLESDALRLYLEGNSYEEMAVELADVLVRQRRFAEADSIYRSSLAVLRRRTTETHVDVRRTYRSLATLYDAWGKRDSAATFRRLAEPRIR